MDSTNGERERNTGRRCVRCGERERGNALGCWLVAVWSLVCDVACADMARRVESCWRRIGVIVRCGLVGGLRRVCARRVPSLMDSRGACAGRVVCWCAGLERGGVIAGGKTREAVGAGKRKKREEMWLWMRMTGCWDKGLMVLVR